MSLLLDPPEAASPGPQTFAQPGVAVGEVAADAVESSAPMAAPAIAAPGIRRIASGPLLAIAIVSVLAGATLFVSGWSLGRAAATTPGTPNSDADEFQAFWDAYGAVTQRYAGGLVDRKTLVEGAIKGLIDSLGDPYSQYLTSQQYRDNLRGLSGQFEGIGATLSTRGSNGLVSTCSPLGPDCHLAIQVPLDGSPALKAGLSAGDVVEAVDNKAVDGLTIDEARNLIRGPRDTNVVLRIVRGRGLPFDVHLTRAVIVQQEVVTRELAGGTVGYVKLTGFSEQSADQFATAIKADVDAGRRKIIVD
ncbi:MAG: S41 family peptidase, partial [Chloroflexota bacterium]